MDVTTRQMVLGWLEQHYGNCDALARWMRDSLRIGNLRACRALITEALTEMR